MNGGQTGKRTQGVSYHSRAHRAHSQAAGSSKHHVALVVVLFLLALSIPSLAAVLGARRRASGSAIVGAARSAAGAGVVAVCGHGWLRRDVGRRIPQRAASGLDKVPALELLRVDGEPLVGDWGPIAGAGAGGGWVR